MSGLIVSGKLIRGVTISDSYESNVVDCPNDRRVSITASWDGTLTATFHFQTRDHPSDSFEDDAIADAEFVTQGNPSGSPGSCKVNFVDVPGKQWRLRLSDVTGSGSLTVTFAQGDSHEV